MTSEITNLIKTDDDISHESDEQTPTDIKSEFTVDMEYDKELKNIPEVKKFIEYLKDIIKNYEKKLRKLKKQSRRLKHKKRVNVATQTDDTENTTASQPKSIVEDITEAAENAVQQSGFVYEATSGMYYDYNTGYYYNAEYGLYYDGNTGIYMKYNEELQKYEFHSQVSLAEQPTVEKETSKRRNDINTREDTKRLKSNDNDVEEGECSDSNDNSSIVSVNSDTENNESTDIAKAWPPCMRMIVQESGIKSVKQGTLYLVTCDGGSLGREGSHAVLLPEVAISKFHARFNFDKDKSLYQLADLGSRNGTLLNGKRISVAKQESEPQDIIHGSIIQVGSVKLLCHIHPGTNTCGQCEPGLIQTTENKQSEQLKPERIKDQHKNELRRLKNKFGIGKSEEVNEIELASGYTDRAEVRRRTVGSQDHNAKTQVASVDQSIASDNKGFKMLAKMGWSEGQALGKEQSGLKEPVQVVSNKGTAGLGTDQRAPEVDKNVIKRQEKWRLAQQRYNNIPENSDDSTNLDD